MFYDNSVDSCANIKVSQEKKKESCQNQIKVFITIFYLKKSE